MKRIAIIMAGGSGERFWPLSRKNHPKQILSLGMSEKTMIEEAVERVDGIIAPEDIFIITSKVLTQPIRNVLENLPPENIIAEPDKRNTAPCLALGAACAMAKYENYSANEISVAVLTADHIMTPLQKFRETISSALDFVEENDVIATIGIPPTRAEIGYGYVELGDIIAGENVKINSVKNFKEKPDEETAKKYLESGNYLWNSGMFFWRLDTFNHDLSIHLPQVGLKIGDMAGIIKMANTFSDKINFNDIDGLNKIFSTFPSISIDFGLMENAGNVVAVCALFDWDDIGDLNSLRRTKKSDENGNILLGRNSLVKTKNSILINNCKSEKILSTIGMDNLIVVVTDDAVLVCNSENVQDVKLVVSDIREKFGEDFL
jgi:mannose-1-phosphate guanylyltransferase